MINAKQPNENARAIDFKVLDKVFIWDNEYTYYPGRVMAIHEETNQLVCLKYDAYVWRKILVYATQISPRDFDFSQHLFEVRKSLLSNSNIKFGLPKSNN